MIYTQNYNPLPWGILSLLLASLPVLILFFLLVVRRASVPWAATPESQPPPDPLFLSTLRLRV